MGRGLMGDKLCFALNASYGKQGLTPEFVIMDEIHDFLDKGLRDLLDEELSKAILTGEKSVNKVRSDMGLPKYNEAEEKDMRFEEPFPIVERVPVFHAISVTRDKLQDIADWLGAKKYTIETLKNGDPLVYGDTVQVVDFHVKDKKADPAVDFHIMARIGADYVVRDPETAGFFVLGNFAFNERFQAPRIGESDLPCR